ncbi:hypothetical protein JCM5350_000416 [Sporobolomyces pararoseus]
MATPSHTITLDPNQYDQEQINLMEERLILLDNDDNAIGEGSKKDCHLIPPPSSSSASEERGRSPLHRAFSVFLFHPETGKLLLQKRADEKITFPKMWTNTCCSHPLTSFGEMEEPNQIGVRRAAARKLEHELGIPKTYELDDFSYLTRIHYYAKSDEIWAEHEIDYILFLTLAPEFTINPNEVSATKWVSKQELIEFFKDPTSTFTPWFKLIAESFLYKWWDALLDSRKGQGSLLDAKDLNEVVAKEQETMGEIIRM